MNTHILTKYGTTRCPVERVAANVDDGECSACGATVNDQPDTLTARTEALNRVAAENDRLRDEVERLKRDVAGQTRSAQNGWRTADAFRGEVSDLRRRIEDLTDGLCQCGNESCVESAWLIALTKALGEDE